MYRTSFIDQGLTEEQDPIRSFFKASKEAFSAYSAHMSAQSKFFLHDYAKFYEYVALEGARIG